jgi:NADH dehydrogenase
MIQTNPKRVVIIGGGFAGINFAEQLLNNDNFSVTLVDKNNYNFFPPLLYQVATGYIESSNISYPFRKFFSGKKNFFFRMGTLIKVVQEENKVLLTTGELGYDILVFATGTETNFFGMENVKQNSIPMKTVEDAIFMRNTLLERLEQASRESDLEERRKLLTIVVAGGGPTGVEISGMFADMKKLVVPKDYPELIGSNGEIYLVDGLTSVLTPIKLNCMVKDFVNDTVEFSNGEKIEAKTLIWAAGVTSIVFDGIAKESYGRGKRMLVDEFNKVQGTRNIYAIGDTCLQTTDPDFVSGHPQVAQVAIQQGKNLGKNLIRIIEGKTLLPFRYKDKGSMAIIGRNKAVADIPKPSIHFDGFIAWLAWMFVHLVSIIVFGNRIKTLYNWVVSYFSKDQSLRVILRPSRSTLDHS